MEKPIVVRGKLTDPRHIELDGPITEIQGAIEVLVRPAPLESSKNAQDTFDFIASLPSGTRSEEDVDQHIREEAEARSKREARTARLPFYRSATREEWERAFEAWVNGHDRSVPLPSPGSLRREAIYEERV